MPRAATHSSTAPRLAIALLALLATHGCAATPVPAPAGDVDRRAVYQQIANVLPRAHFGWGEPPGVIEMAASTRADGPPPTPPPLIANERGFRVVAHVYRPRDAWIPYDAIEAVTSEWSAMPNVLFAALPVLPLQARRLTVVFDAAQVPSLRENLLADAKRLEAISRETGVAGPWVFAQQVRAELEAAEATHGPGRMALHIDFMVPIPAVIPWRGEDWRTGEAFAWAAANPNAPELEPLEPVAPAASAGE